jgi:3-methyladenine DNA glycosylase/8-oxoguanine DNA glycosylase
MADVPTRHLTLDRPLDLGGTLPGIVSGDPSRRRRDGVLRLAGRAPAGPFQVALAVTGGDLAAEAWGPGADAVLDTLPTLVGEHDDATGFNPEHPRLARLHRRHPGLRMGAQGRPWDLLVAAILAQKVTMTETTRALNGLARRHGEPAPGPEGLWVLPAPEVVVAIPSYDLHPLGIERTRAETLRRAARSAGRIERAASGGTTELGAALRSIRGVGPWTTALVLDRALGDPDAVPVGDYHLPNGVAWLLAGEPRGDDDRMLELLEPYRGHRARVLRLVKVSGTRAPKYGPRSTPRDIRGM